MWNWISRFNIGAGLRASGSKNGLGLSWGIRGIRVGVSPSGNKWIYIGIPGTGFGFYKRFYKKKKKVKKSIQWKDIS